MTIRQFHRRANPEASAETVPLLPPDLTSLPPPEADTLVNRQKMEAPSPPMKTVRQQTGDAPS